MAHQRRAGGIIQKCLDPSQAPTNLRCPDKILASRGHAAPGHAPDSASGGFQGPPDPAKEGSENGDEASDETGAAREAPEELPGNSVSDEELSDLFQEEIPFVRGDLHMKLATLRAGVYDFKKGSDPRDGVSDFRL